MQLIRRKLSPFWRSLGKDFCRIRHLSRPLSVLVSNSSLLQRKWRSSRVFSTEASQEEPAEPVPQFKNVLQHLHQLSSLFVTTSPTEKADFTSILEQLAADDHFSSQLDAALKAKMELQPEFLSQQNSLRIKEHALQHRNPLPVFSNGAFIYPNSTVMKLPPNFIFEYISAAILSVLSYRRKLSKESPEEARQMFGSCRRPAVPVDTQNFIEDSTTSDLSLIISRQSNFFHLELNEQMPDGEMFFVLKKVVEFILNYKNVGTVAFGSLSTLPRADATFGYQFLNETAMKHLQEAQFLINLDHLDEKQANCDAEQLVKHILIGDRENVGNRWFDKALQLIVVLNGDSSSILGSGICFEKSLVSTDSVADCMHHGVEYLTKFKPIEIQPEVQSTDQSQLMIKLQKLDLITPGKRDLITSATNGFALKKYVHLANSFHLSRFTFRQYGTAFIKGVNCQTDAWAHAAVGLAYRNYHQLSKSSGATMPSSPVYKDITSEMIDFFEDSLVEEKLRLALESWLFHQQLAERGYDIENILRVYKVLIGEEVESKDLSQKTVDLFSKSLFCHSFIRQLNHRLVHTNRSIPDVVGQPLGIIEASGPLVPGGFACCYQFLGNECIDWTISCQENTEENTAKEFSEYLNHALLQMKSVIAF